jgi:cbb3-type cytochrome oxidase maturation protein
MAWILIVTIGAGLIGLSCFIYFLKKEQFDDCEDIKYQVFRED